MGMSKEKIAETLNAHRHLGYSNWAFDQFGFIAGEDGETAKMGFYQAEGVAQGYMIDKAEADLANDPSHLASLGCVPNKGDNLLLPDDEIVHRMSEYREHLLIDDSAFAAQTIRLGLDLIKRLQGRIDRLEHEIISREIEPSAIPTADEALAIINANDHRDTQWKLLAIDEDDAGEDLSHEELIGTAMYYKAKGVQ